MVETVLKLAEVGDAEQIAACVEAAYVHYVGRMGMKPGPMLDNYAEVVAEHAVWVIKNDEQVVGLLVLIDKGLPTLLLDNVAVHPDFQGHGFGRKLMTFAESEAKRRGFDGLHLYTHELMTENIEIYARYGYVEFERRQELGFARVYMRKLLSV